MSEPTPVKVTTIGGTLFIILANINSSDILRTIVLATIGAVVSFMVSLVIRKAVKWWNAHKG